MFFKNILNKIDGLNNKKPVLNAVLSVMTLLAIFSLKTALTMRTINWYAPTIAGCCCFTAVLAFLMVRKKSLKLTKSGWFILAAEVIIGLSFLGNGLLLRVKAYCVIGVVFAFVIPVIQYALATNDAKKVAERFCMTLVISYILLLIVNMFMGPILVKFQYGSIMGNSNLLGYYLAVLIPSLTYLLLKKDLSFAKRAVCWGLLVSAVTMLVFTSSRTSALALFFSMGFFLLTLFFGREKKENKRKFNKKRIIIIVIITVAVPFILFFMLSYVRKQIVIFSHRASIKSNNASLSDSEIKEEEKELEEIENIVTEYSLDYYIKGLDGSGEDSFTSGRVAIWKDFVKNLSVKGHAVEHREVIEETRHYDHAKAHNVYIQVAYNAGIGAGAVYLIAVVFVGVQALVWFVNVIRKKKKYDPELLLSYCYFIGFAITSLTSDGYMIYNYFPTTLFWFMAYKYMFKDKQETKEEKE